MRCVGHVAQKEESRNAYNHFIIRPEGKRPLGRPRHRLDNNIKTYFEEK
jgi:hypothetical protein